LFLDSNDDKYEEFENLLPHLPDPTTLDNVLSELRHNLGLFPQAMLGEVGLDRSFRVPLDFSASPRELTTFTIPLKHQLSVLEAQLDVAVELGRNVSFHSVKAQMCTLELLDRMSRKHGDNWRDISIDIHSCSLSSQMWKDMEVPNSMTL
jgi:Tat protein secretion system quality control protein TatD with DNase activity